MLRSDALVGSLITARSSPTDVMLDVHPNRMFSMNSATLSPKFQLSIPKSVRDELGLHAGQKFAVIPTGKVIELVPLISLDEARGLLKGADPTEYRDRSDLY